MYSWPTFTWCTVDINICSNKDLYNVYKKPENHARFSNKVKLDVQVYIYTQRPQNCSNRPYGDAFAACTVLKLNF